MVLSTGCKKNSWEAGIYCKPMSEAVSNAMRMLSVEPLTEGVPCHCATDGIFPWYYPRPCTVAATWAQSRALLSGVFA